MSNAITDAFNPDMNYDVAGAMRKANASVMSDIQVGGSVMMESKQSAHINVTVGGQEFETFSENIHARNTKRLNFKDSYRSGGGDIDVHIRISDSERKSLRFLSVLLLMERNWTAS